ncbi:hypothetical protein [Marinobacter sp. S6332]|uniref:hypothetical protein n=1 Tax=Marinobacter sp. S6332 TaxID=2926403 RepID=UPI001FF2F91A|nr:hypothetical protein [Marinobacter sp. S6332]MCK0165743.1 hypothetical protein [Marinobacter sp. S6332]
MELLFNECSLHGQFTDVQSFVTSLDVLMGMRQVAKRYGRELYCRRTCQQARVTHQLTLPQAIQYIEKDKVRALMGWFNRTGPYWEESQHHSGEEYLACQGELVTDTAIGECAHLQFSNRKAELVSLSPSQWTSTPLEVEWYKDDVGEWSVTLTNHTGIATLEAALLHSSPMLQSWGQMEQACLSRFDNLTFSEDAFSPLKGTPFVVSAANSIVDLLAVLSEFKAAHLTGEGRTERGHIIYQQYFTGGNAWYSDSSNREKSDFENDMTFRLPGGEGESLFAPFHGKVQTPQLRIHFSWPIKTGTPLYVLYVGPKITKY